MNMQPKDAKQYNGLSLAFIGDCVYELLVREHILSKKPVNQLHKETVNYVCASAQSKAVELIIQQLSEEELSVYKRGRNTNSNTVPKNADPQDYRRATGLEALFGYLYLTGNTARISELFDIIFTNGGN